MYIRPQLLALIWHASELSGSRFGAPRETSAFTFVVLLGSHWDLGGGEMWADAVQVGEAVQGEEVAWLGRRCTRCGGIDVDHRDVLLFLTSDTRLWVGFRVFSSEYSGVKFYRSACSAYRITV